MNQTSARSFRLLDALLSKHVALFVFMTVAIAAPSTELSEDLESDQTKNRIDNKIWQMLKKLRML